MAAFEYRQAEEVRDALSRHGVRSPGRMNRAE
jgi:hypothetical protein